MAIDEGGYILPTIKLERNPYVESSGVYFLQSSEGYIKIGQSRDVIKRLATYKTHNFTIRMVGYIWTVEKFLEIEETIQHEVWDQFRISLEWFAPVKPLISYLSWFWNGYGSALMEYEKKPETYQELIDCERRYHQYAVEHNFEQRRKS